MYYEHSTYFSILRGTNPETNERAWIARVRVTSQAVPESNEEITEVVNSPEEFRKNSETMLFHGSKSDLLEASLKWAGENQHNICPPPPDNKCSVCLGTRYSSVSVRCETCGGTGEEIPF